MGLGNHKDGHVPSRPVKKRGRTAIRRLVRLTTVLYGHPRPLYGLLPCLTAPIGYSSALRNTSSSGCGASPWVTPKTLGLKPRCVFASALRRAKLSASRRKSVSQQYGSISASKSIWQPSPPCARGGKESESASWAVAHVVSGATTAGSGISCSPSLWTVRHSDINSQWDAVGTYAAGSRRFPHRSKRVARTRAGVKHAAERG
jgi:hypothetical protein